MNDVKSTKQPLYPSQINTKTISCRISAQDYVTFLNEAVTNGITLNDWLLMKIYNRGISAVPGHLFSESDSNKTNHSEIFRLIAEDEDIDKYRYLIMEKIDDIEKLEVDINSNEGVYMLIKRLASNLNTLFEYNQKASENRRRQALERQKELLDINNIKAQILTLAQTRFDNQKDLKSYMSDVSFVLSEIS